MVQLVLLIKLAVAAFGTTLLLRAIWRRVRRRETSGQLDRRITRMLKIVAVACLVGILSLVIWAYQLTNRWPAWIGAVALGAAFVSYLVAISLGVGIGWRSIDEEQRIRRSSGDPK